MAYLKIGKKAFLKALLSFPKNRNQYSTTLK